MPTDDANREDWVGWMRDLSLVPDAEYCPVSDPWSLPRLRGFDRSIQGAKADAFSSIPWRRYREGQTRIFS